MRITIVTRIFAPEPSAASLRLEALTRALSDRGDHVTVLTVRSARSLRRREPEVARRLRGVRLRRWPVLRDRSGYVRGYLPYLSFDVPAFFRVLFGRRADVMVIEPPPTTGAIVGLAARLRRVPYVYYAADVWSLASAATGAPDLVLRVVRMLEASALRGGRAVLAVSEGVADGVRALAPTADVRVVGHGVDDRVFHGDVSGGDATLSGPDALYMGTASEWHGAGVFVQALGLLARRGVRPEVEFVGQGSEWQMLQDAVAAEGLDGHVRFLPPVGPDEAARKLRTARVALASLRPGIGYDFAVPTKMYAAVAVGTPVLIAAPPGLRERVRSEGLGWGCAMDATDVADALEQAVASEPGLTRRGELAEWAVANVSASAVAARALRVIDESVR